MALHSNCCQFQAIQLRASAKDLRNQTAQSDMIPPATLATESLSNDHKHKEEHRRMDALAVDMLQQRCRDGEVPFSVHLAVATSSRYLATLSTLGYVCVSHP
jgi:hypothetical protein